MSLFGLLLSIESLCARRKYHGKGQVFHYGDVKMGAIASQITSLTIVYSAVYSDADQRKYQSSALLAFVWGIHRGPVNSPHKWPVTRKMLSFDDVIMFISQRYHWMSLLDPALPTCFWQDCIGLRTNAHNIGNDKWYHNNIFNTYYKSK